MLPCSLISVFTKPFCKHGNQRTRRSMNRGWFENSLCLSIIFVIKWFSKLHIVISTVGRNPGWCTGNHQDFSLRSKWQTRACLNIQTLKIKTEFASSNTLFFSSIRIQDKLSACLILFKPMLFEQITLMNMMRTTHYALRTTHHVSRFKMESSFLC